MRGLTRSFTNEMKVNFFRAGERHSSVIGGPKAHCTHCTNVKGATTGTEGSQGSNRGESSHLVKESHAGAIAVRADVISRGGITQIHVESLRKTWAATRFCAQLGTFPTLNCWWSLTATQSSFFTTNNGWPPFQRSCANGGCVFI